jgi:hypothetical protein
MAIFRAPFLPRFVLVLTIMHLTPTPLHGRA